MTKILIDLATAEQAFEALKEFGYHGSSPRWERTANALKAALEQQPVQEPTPWRDMVVVSLVREGVNKHKARELADHFATQPLPVQEPWGACVSGRVFVGALPEHVRKLSEDDGLPIQLLYTAPPQRKPLTDDVLVPLEVLEAAASSLDSFCGNLGWGDADLQNMDNLFALISQHKAAHGIEENT